jgi:hypothetical protein
MLLLLYMQVARPFHAIEKIQVLDSIRAAASAK